MSACGKPAKIEIETTRVSSLHLGGEIVEPPHRPASRALAPQGRQEGRLPERDGRPDPSGDDVEEPGRRLGAPLGHVHVGIGLVTVEEVGAADHRLREIGVKVERHRDRNPRADRLPDGRDQVTLAVVQPLRHHRAVEIEEHAREGASPVEVREHAFLHVVEDVPRHPPGRRGRGGDGRHQREARLRRGLDHAAEARAGVAEVLDDLPAVPEVPGLELPPIGRDAREGVRLVRHHRQEGLHAVASRHCRMWGSSQSRSAFPMRLIASVVTKIARPGKVAIHHELSM